MKNPHEMELRSHIYPRVNVSQAATEMVERINRGEPAFPTDDALSRFCRGELILSPQDAINLYTKSKKERYACAAIVDNAVITHATQGKKEMPPFGLITQEFDKDYNFIKGTKPNILTAFTTRNPYAELHIAMRGTLDTYYRYDITKIEEGKMGEAPLQAVNRLKMWQKIYDAVPNDEKGNPGMYEGDSILNPAFSREDFTGALTGVRHMSSLLQILPIVLVKDLPNHLPLTADTIHATAVASFPLISKIAMLDQDTASGLELALYGNENSEMPHRLNPYNFSLVGFKEEVAIIDFAPEVWKKALEIFIKNQRNRKLTGNEFAGGCPVMASIEGDKSAMLKLWSWYTDIGEHIYNTFEAPRLKYRRRHREKL